MTGYYTSTVTGHKKPAGQDVEVRVSSFKQRCGLFEGVVSQIARNGGDVAENGGQGLVPNPGWVRLDWSSGAIGHRDACLEFGSSRHPSP